MADPSTEAVIGHGLSPTGWVDPFQSLTEYQVLRQKELKVATQWGSVCNFED